MGSSGKDMVALCELANEVEADGLLDALEAAGVSGGQRRATEASATAHAAWEILVPQGRQDSARDVLKAFRGEHGDRDLAACPGCGYSLEGLPACEKCPECGMNLGDFRARTTRILTRWGRSLRLSSR